MGIPKFFRWMSERYPLCSQLIERNNIPEFDNLYLDMNGIIHNSTHKNDHGIGGSMSEDKMYLAIFNYIEHLFGTIKPKKVFFMAIDGCAPRAKMNQQRSRRFRTAKDAHDARQAAIKRGEELPKEDPFDSNCITPGTVFMAKLSRQLQYFINKKVSEDADWRDVTIILSGHDVPGEGEHKIMEYIRASKAQPGYDPNVRECLYGLDADLIMLGLLSHEPHFCLLREEVTFGPSRDSKNKELNEQNFFLMHLSLLREYLELEFKDLRETLEFEYDLERIIDDFILMAFFVGNDFLPNLPNLHINEGALALMYKVYREVLPQCGGYINDNGVINKDRLRLLLGGLEQFEKEYYEAESHDASYFKTKEGGHLDSIKEAKARNRLILTEAQRDVVNQVKAIIRAGPQAEDSAVLVPHADDEAKAFVEMLASDLSLKRKNVQQEVDGVLQTMTKLTVNDTPSAKSAGDVKKELARYAKAPVVKTTLADAEAEMQRLYDEKFDAWKSEYYQEKLGFKLSDEEALRKMTQNYCEGLQWVLFYYYRGVASWGWFYAYHYSPKISDVKKGLDADFEFTLGEPFRPFEQLMGVLPERSKKLVPEPFQELMTEDTSPIHDFYPNDFPLDMNGKKAEWEAVVKIPFIDEKRLLGAMKTKEARLTADERARNVFGLPIQFTHDASLDQIYPSSLPGMFPDLRSYCRMTPYELPSIEGVVLRQGLTPGVMLGVEALAGFPSLHTLPFRSELEMHGINVFQRESKNETVVLYLDDGAAEEEKTQKLAEDVIGSRVFVNWPYLQEAEVVAISDEYFRYEKADLSGGNKRVVPIQHKGGPDSWLNKSRRLNDQLSRRTGIVAGTPGVVYHVAPLRGLMRTDEGAMVKDFQLEGAPEQDYLRQTVVSDVVQADARYLEREALDVSIEYPIGTRVFFLGEYNYGRPARVTDHGDGKVDIVIAALKSRAEPEFSKKLIAQAGSRSKYYPSPVVGRMVGMSALCLSKLTSSFAVVLDGDRVNLGLNLKFEGKKLKVLGYTRRNEQGWEYSDKAVGLVQDYKRKFPTFIATLEKLAKKANHDATDFFDKAQARPKVKEIQQWLKANEVKTFDKVPLEAQELDRETIVALEEAANKLNAATASEVEAKKVRGAPRSALLKPQDSEHRLGGQSFALGDRVTYVADSGKVPIATRGTCVGVHKDTLDVVFDTAFMSGTMLGGRCSEYRGMTVPYWTVLNTTSPTVLAVSKAGIRKPVAAAKGGATNGRQAHANGGHGHGRAAAPSLQNGGSGTGPQRLLARNSNRADGQYYNDNAGRNFQPRGPNAWQARANTSFLQGMLNGGPNGGPNGGANANGVYGQYAQGPRVVMNNGMPTVLRGPAPAAQQQQQQNGHGNGHGQGGRGARGGGRGGRGGANRSAGAGAGSGNSGRGQSRPAPAAQV